MIILFTQGPIRAHYAAVTVATGRDSYSLALMYLVRIIFAAV